MNRLLRKRQIAIRTSGNLLLELGIPHKAQKRGGEIYFQILELRGDGFQVGDFIVAVVQCGAAHDLTQLVADLIEPGKVISGTLHDRQIFIRHSAVRAITIPKFALAGREPKPSKYTCRFIRICCAHVAIIVKWLEHGQNNRIFFCPCPSPLRVSCQCGCGSTAECGRAKAETIPILNRDSPAPISFRGRSSSAERSFDMREAKRAALFAPTIF